MAFEIGIMTFGEITEDPVTGTRPSPRQRAREVIELAEVADQAGLDVFGVGEHHRGDFVGSAPTILLAAAAEKTERIRLTSSVTVLSSEDPVRVWEQFATIDLLSRGPGAAGSGRNSSTPTSHPAPTETPSRSGWVLAGRRRPPSAPAGSACRWRSPSCSAH